MGVAQWLTLLVPPVLAIKPKKRGRTEITPKKATKRRQLLEKHTLGWTPDDEGKSSQKPEPAGNGKEKLTRKASRTKEPVEEGPLLQKPIKFKVRRPKQEQEDFVQKIHLGITKEEAEEEPAETLERHATKRSQEQRAKEPAPIVVETQQRAKEPTPTIVETQEREEPGATWSEALTDQPDFGREQVSAPVIS